MTLTNTCYVSRARTESRRWRGLGCVLVVSIFLALFWTRGYTLPAAAHWLDIGQPPTKTDYVLVLSGHNDTRPFAAAELVLNGFAPQALITSTKQSQESQVRFPQKHILMKCGVSEANIDVLDGDCSTTMHEAQALARFLENHPDATVSLVTNTYHTRRARMAFRAALGGRIGHVHFISAPNDGFDASNWWKNEEGFVWHVMEYGKLVFYALRYGNGVWWCVAFIAAAGALVTVRRSHIFRKADAVA